MKKLFKRIIILGSVITFISIIVSLFFPFFWGDNIQVSKINFYKENKHKFNALFFGGSLEYRHISPYILKNSLAKKDINFSAFNFGVDSHNFTQSISEAERIINDTPNDSIKYVFISLSTEAYMSSFNLHSNKQISWINLKTLYRLCKILYHQKTDDLIVRITNAYGYIFSFFENRLNFGKLEDKLEYVSIKNNFDSVNLGKHLDGFVPLELDANGQVANPETEVTKYILMVSNIEYKKKADSVNTFINSILKTYYDTTQHDKKNIDYLYELCVNMINNCKKKGISVIFFLPPRVPSGYKQLVPIYNRLPNTNKFDLADAKANLEFYEPKYGFDNFHMNAEGAEIYSNRMADKIGNLIN